jgi:hypothetical protein
MLFLLSVAVAVGSAGGVDAPRALSCDAAAIQSALDAGGYWTFTSNCVLPLPAALTMSSGTTTLDGGGFAVTFEGSAYPAKPHRLLTVTGGFLTLNGITLADVTLTVRIRHGSAGSAGAPGQNGADGAGPGASGQPGAPGTAGSPGGDGPAIAVDPPESARTVRGGCVLIAAGAVVRLVYVNVMRCGVSGLGPSGGGSDAPNGGDGGAGAAGGDGGRGGDGAQAGGKGGTGGAGATPAAGGDGGRGADGVNVLGGAIFNAGSLTIVGSDFDSNQLRAGAGGSGGYGGAGGNGGAGGAGGAGLATLSPARIDYPGGDSGNGGNGASGGRGGQAGAGGDARGGAIYNEGTRTIGDSRFQRNLAQAGDGGSGGGGGDGGNGGNASEGGTGSGPSAPAGRDGAPGAAGDGGAAGNGGRGGSALGGAIYSTTDVTLANVKFQSNRARLIGLPCGATTCNGGTSAPYGGYSKTGRPAGVPGRLLNVTHAPVVGAAGAMGATGALGPTGTASDDDLHPPQQSCSAQAASDSATAARVARRAHPTVRSPGGFSCNLVTASLQRASARANDRRVILRFSVTALAQFRGIYELTLNLRGYVLPEQAFGGTIGKLCKRIPQLPDLPIYDKLHCGIGGDGWKAENVSFVTEKRYPAGRLTELETDLGNRTISIAGKPESTSPLAKEARKGLEELLAETKRELLAHCAGGAGVELIGTGTLALAGIALGPLGDAIAIASAGHTLTKCAELNHRAETLKAELAADPPDPRISQVNLPTAPRSPGFACRPVQGIERQPALRACRLLSPSLARSMQASSHTNAIIDALLATANRFGTAVRAGDQGSAQLQSAASVILTQELSGAVTREHADELRAVTALRSRGALPVPSRSNVARIARALMSRRSFSAFARRYLGPALTPRLMARKLTDALHGERLRRFDLTRELRSATSPHRLRATAGEIGAPDVTAVVDALSAQGRIGAALHGRLTDALAQVETGGPAAARAALARLTTITAAVPGELGGFLKAASEAIHPK